MATNEGRRLKRIVKEVSDLVKERKDLEQNGIFIDYESLENSETIGIIKFLIIGPSDTCYSNGFYFFTAEYPSDYPMTPPQIKYCTQGSLLNPSNPNIICKIRFNPNLYTCGKVCLSILNTWRGDGWRPTYTLEKVFFAIQALVLTSTPLKNEPGFENSNNLILSNYSNIIEYAKFKIAVS